MPAVLLGVPPSSVQRSDRLTRTALGVALGSALLGVGLGALHRVGGYRVETDFYVYYLPQAREIIDGPPLLRGLVHNPPGFALLIGLGSKLLRDEFAAAKLLGALAAGAFVWVAFRLTQRSFGSSVALTVALFLAIAVAPYSYLAATDVLGAFAMTAPVWWLVSRLRVGAPECFVTGVMVGVAYLLRSNTIAMLPVLTLAIPYGFLRHQPRRLRWRAAGVPGLRGA